MSTIDTTQLDCIDVEQQSTDTVLKTLVAEVSRLKQQNQQQQKTIEQQQETIDELSENTEENADDIQQISDELDEERETRAKESAEDRKRITELENRIEDSETQPSDGENKTPEPYVTPDTPLEQVTALPQEMINEESPNVRRAIFVASGVHDYSRKVPAGRAIKSSELRKVLKAGTDANGHTETVSRVMDVLDDMGGDDVKIVDRRGEKRVVFTERAADRLTELVEQKRSSNHTVVMGETG